MFRNIFINELKINLKSVSFYVFSGIFFIITFMFASNTDPTVGIVMIVGREWHNAPLVIARIFAFISVYGILFTMVIAGRAVTKDFDVGIHEFFFTIPLRKNEYLGGRFLGGLTTNLIVFGGVILGLVTGCLIIDPKYYGPFSISEFLRPIIIILIPNLLLIGSIFFSLATLSRKMVLTYLAGVGMLIVYGFISLGLMFVENDIIRVLADPFAIASLNVLTQYWTVSDINANIMPVSGLLLLNRFIWLSVSFAILYYTWRKFKFISMSENKSSKNNLTFAESDFETEADVIPVRTIAIEDSFWFQLKKCFHLAAIEFKRIGLHPAFLIITFMAMLNIALNFYGSLDMSGNSLYPMTSWFIEQTDLMWIYVIPLIIFLGGMLVWRERDNKSNQFYDTLPLPGWMSYFSKLFALMNVLLFFQSMIMLTGIFSQVFFFGWTEIEPELYLKQLFGIDLLNYWHMAVVVLLVQNLTPNKYFGLFICAVYFAIDIFVFLVFGFDNILLRYGHIPDISHSNLNGFGHYAQIIIWYTAYWLAFAGIVIIISILLWRRDEEVQLKFRLNSAKQDLGKNYKIFLAVFIFLFVSIGSFIYYNKYILNQYISEDKHLSLRADYEKKYSLFKNLSQPKMKHVQLKVDFFPDERDALIQGYYILINKTECAIDTILINLSDRKISKVNKLEFNKTASLLYEGDEFGFRMFKLNESLLPGEQISLNFDLEARTFGFTENNPKNELLQNGSLLLFSAWEPNQYFPIIGYANSYEIERDYSRVKYGLDQRLELPTLENAYPIKNTSFVTYDAIISTNKPQTVVSNGEQVEHWTENSRNYFLYKSDVPMQNDIIIISGEYEVSRDEQDSISIEVYYNKKHPWNIPRIIKGIKHSLNYCETNFCKYPYSAFRVVEIPDYDLGFGARSQPSIVIWNEHLVFISNVEDPDDIDHVYSITAHELAHNWWPDIVVPAMAEGIDLVTEGIAQHVRTMCLEKEYGKKLTRKHLKNEMKDYLRLRNRETSGERPLIKSYIRYYLSYAKTSLAMYALKDYIGENTLNKALKNLVNNFGYKEEPGFTSPDLINAFKSATPDSLQYIITDWFETITLYENKAITAESKVLENGKYKVKITVEARKFRADSVGTQTEIPIGDYINIGVLGENEKELYLKKHKITRNHSTIEILVDEKPMQAGIDPYQVLIDRNRENNIVNVQRNE